MSSPRNEYKWVELLPKSIEKKIHNQKIYKIPEKKAKLYRERLRLIDLKKKFGIDIKPYLRNIGEKLHDIGIQNPSTFDLRTEKD